MKSEHVLKIPFSLPDSGTRIFSVRMVVERSAHLRGVSFASSPDLPGLHIKVANEFDLESNFLDCAIAYLNERFQCGWKGDTLNFHLGFGWNRISTKKLSLAEKARRLATDCHAKINHVRMYTGEPYINHLAVVVDLMVRNCVNAVTGEMVAAAWLHDTVEVAGLSFGAIERDFGPEVGVLVRELTDSTTLKDGNRKTRKAIELKRINRISPEAKTIKLADLIDNAKSIIKHDPKFAQVFIPEMRDLLHVLSVGDSNLYTMAWKIVNDWTKAECSQLIKETFGDDSKSYEDVIAAEARSMREAIEGICSHYQREIDRRLKRRGLSISMGCRYNWTNFTD